MSPAKQKSFQAAVDKAIAWSAAEHLKREAELADELQEAGPRGLHPGRQGVPRPRAEGLPCIRPGEGLAEGDAREDQRAEVTCAAARPRLRPACVAQRGGTRCIHRKAAAGCGAARRTSLAGLLGVMFVAFIVQIVFRYFFNFPIGWTSELTVITWLWLVLWGAAFVVKESEEIRFDLVYGAGGPPRRASSWRRRRGRDRRPVRRSRCRRPSSYVTFMKVEKSSYLKIRIDWLYSIYVVFVVAVIVRYLWLLCRACCAARRRKRPTRPRRPPACEPSPAPSRSPSWRSSP